MNHEQVLQAMNALDRWLKSQEIDDIGAWRVLLGMLLVVVSRNWSVEQYSRMEANLAERIHAGLEYYRKVQS